MYMDDVLPAVTAAPVREQRPQTPIRRSGTLNNPEAYPSPESAPRNLSAQPTTPPGTPTRGRSRSRTPTTPGTFDQDPAGDDDEMDVDIEVPGTSNILFGQNLMTSEQDIQTEDFEAIQQAETGRLLSRIAWKNWTSFLWKMKYFRIKKDYDDLRSEVDKYKKDHADLRATAMAAVLAMSGPQF
ncbi:hypothetical protein GALMADRAFT_222278 [Galerina marginata CBS 339.88]|uniref:Uncharacterized protein n=1 Tax=Galerina marginata (strain CBS 339.88) TaxID=685588 RepID=A0A067TBT3_GALM3|nr:hypothetical protein GALMADRAFT_222278 [Galerina marginata CBS 339.88]